MNQLKINKEKRFSSFFDQINELRKIDFLVLHHIEAISVNHAIEQCADTITEILGDDDWEVNTIDEIHRRIVKENPKRWSEWQDWQSAHVDLNK